MLGVRPFLSSKLIRNGAWLYLLHLFNSIIPLLALPYVTRVLGVSVYGTFSFALNIVGYFQVIVEYGFNLSGSRKIAAAKSQEEIEEIYSSITTSKIILCIISFSILSTTAQFMEIGHSEYICMLVLFLLVVGSSLQQTWLFQGLETMKYITISNVSARTVSLMLIFIFVQNPSDLYLYCFLYSITYLLVGLIGIYITSNNLKVKYRIANLNEVLDELKDGWALFTTTAMSRIFGAFGVTIIGVTGSVSDVGIYSAIQKIPLILIMLFSPVGQVIYPHVSKYYINSFTKGLNFVKKVATVAMSLFLVLSIPFFLYSEIVVKMLFGEEYVAYSLLLLPLTCWMLVSILNNFLGIQIVVASGYQREYSAAFRWSLISMVLLSLLLGSTWGVFGIATATLLSEIHLMLLLSYKIKKIMRLEIV